jgi:streptogramin lyase
MRRQTAVLAALLLTGFALMLGASAPASGTVSGTNVLYTLDLDFDQGTLVNVNHDAPNNNQLQLNTSSGTFPFIWIALSQRCTIAKINTATGAILGEYRTISDGVGCAESSRTTVGIDGSVWVGHRGPGGVNHVGLAELNQCLDRNGNGTIETSTGYGDVLAWPGTDSNVATAVDECILHHVNTHLTPLFMGDSRHMSIDANNKLWVGDFAGGGKFVRIDGTTGVVETAVRDHACGGYGGLIDGNGVIWSAQGSLLRWNPDAPDDATNPRCISGTNVYGLAVDGNGSIWTSVLSGGVVRKVSSDGNTISAPFPHGSSNAQGLAADSNGDIWVSSSLFCSSGCTIGHLKNDGTFVGSVPTPTGAGSTGVAVDAAGKIWAANRSSNTATRIDPTLGPLGCGGTGCADGTTRVGEVDLTVSFPATAGRPLPFPYNYSDMTGAQLFNSTAPQGTWTVTQDGTAPATEWGTITWNTEPQGAVPAGASLTVEARTAESEAGLGSANYVEVTNATAFSLIGRFIQVRVTFKPNADGASPILSDIRIQAKAVAATGKVVGKGSFQGTTPGRVNFEVDASAAGGTFFLQTANNDQLNATTVEGFSRVDNTASFHGTGTWNGVAGHTYEVSFVDNGFPGRNDTINVVVRNAAGAVVFTSGGPKLLKTGNITVSD